MKQSQTLICIPCFNSEDTIRAVIRPLLDHTDADLLLVDDRSDTPLVNYMEAYPGQERQRIEVLRPDKKVYSGGAKNIGLQRALDNKYEIAVMLDSDIILSADFLPRVRDHFRQFPSDVVAAPAILPSGNIWQYTDTSINFSSYLPDRSRRMSRKKMLAGYAFAVNVDVFATNPCFHESRYGGEDVLFFRKLREHFGISGFPILNELTAIHLPPRKSMRDAVVAQRRYGRAFFTHNDGKREAAFNELPWLHLLTPRFFLMIARLIRRHRFADLWYSPFCWMLDLARAHEILQRHREGYRDPSRASATVAYPLGNRLAVWRNSDAAKDHRHG